MTEFLRGSIRFNTEVEQFTKKTGEVSVKCMFHIVDDNGTERAIVATGDNTNYAGCQGMRVEVGYVNRVFHFVRNGKDWIGNDLYMTSIKRV